MFKFKYKFKKVIRFINKILRVILIFGCITSLLCFNASAAVYRDDDNFLDAFANSSADVYSASRGEEYELTSKKMTHTYCYTISKSVRGYEYANFYLDENVLNRIQAGNMVVFKGMLMIRNDLGKAYGDPDDLVNYLVNNSCGMALYFQSSTKSFLLQSDLSPVAYVSSKDHRYYARYDFNVEFTIPEDFDYYDDVSLWFNLNFEVDGSGYIDSKQASFYLGSDSLRFYVGDRDNAPLYSGYESDTPSRVEDLENEAFEDAAEGLDEVGSFVNQFESILLYGGPTVAGLQFIGMFMNDLYLQIPWLNTLLVISLALGVITVILGVFHIVKKG